MRTKKRETIDQDIFEIVFLKNTFDVFGAVPKEIKQNQKQTGPQQSNGR